MHEEKIPIAIYDNYLNNAASRTGLPIHVIIDLYIQIINKNIQG